MRILIVEDDSFKMDAIFAIISTHAPIASLSSASSLRSAMTILESTEFDYVVLDMAIPSHTSDVGAIDTYSQPVGGLDVLLFLAANDRSERVVILTQYPTVEYDQKHVPLKDLVEVLHRDDVRNAVAAVLFSEDGLWERDLRSVLGVAP